MVERSLGKGKVESSILSPGSKILILWYSSTMGIKKVEKTTSKYTIALKLSFLCIIILIGLFASFRPKVEPLKPPIEETSLKSKKNTESVLGIDTQKTANELQKQLSSDMLNFSKQAADTKDTILSESESFLRQTSQELQKNTTNLLFQSAIKPILDKINTLPKSQQDYLKDQICK